MMLYGAILAILAIALLRFAWSRDKRSVPLNGLAWGALLLGIVLSGFAYGAWGIAVAGLAATATASVLLTHAAIVGRSPPKREPKRRANVLPEDAPLRIGGRLLTFLLTVPMALAVSLILCVALDTLGRMGGWYEADSIMLALMMLPLVWAVFCTSLLMTEKRLRQGAILAAPALISGIVLLVGGVK